MRGGRRRIVKGRARRAFSLVEVLLAVGVFSVAVLALIALIGPLLSDLREARDDAAAESVLALAAVLAREEGSEWESVLAAGGTVVRFIAPPARGAIGDADNDVRDLVFDEDGLRARLAAGVEIGGSVTELRGRHAPAAVPQEAPHRVVVFEARNLPPPEPDSDTATYLARFRALSPNFTFPVLVRP
ncbi:MAG: hypothetical protein JJU00_14665 [Opitutales bacterium]|nr:hypothetical protein [Opitutales bacterium]